MFSLGYEALMCYAHIRYFVHESVLVPKFSLVELRENATKICDAKIPKLGTKSPTETQKSTTSARLDSLTLQVANIADVLARLERQLSAERGTFDSGKLREGLGGQIVGKAEFSPTGGNNPDEAALESAAKPVAMEGKRQPLVDLGDAFPGWKSALSGVDSDYSQRMQRATFNDVHKVKVTVPKLQPASGKCHTKWRRHSKTTSKPGMICCLAETKEVLFPGVKNTVKRVRFKRSSGVGLDSCASDGFQSNMTDFQVHQRDRLVTDLTPIWLALDESLAVLRGLISERFS